MRTALIGAIAAALAVAAGGCGIFDSNEDPYAHLKPVGGGFYFRVGADTTGAGNLTLLVETQVLYGCPSTCVAARTDVAGDRVNVNILGIRQTDLNCWADTLSPCTHTASYDTALALAPGTYAFRFTCSGKELTYDVAVSSGRARVRGPVPDTTAFIVPGAGTFDLTRPVKPTVRCST